jgi:hypothetical protein
MGTRQGQASHISVFEFHWNMGRAISHEWLAVPHIRLVYEYSFTPGRSGGIVPARTTKFHIGSSIA